MFANISSHNLKLLILPIDRAGLTILGKPGKCPGPRAFGGLALEYQNTALLVFMFLGCSPRVKIVEFLMTAFSRWFKQSDSFGIYRF